MSRHDDATRLRQMLGYAREAAQMAHGRQRAASKVSPGLRTRYQDIEWGPIIGLRNRLIHGYDSIDRDILWQIISVDLPALVARLGRLVEDLNDGSPSAST